MTSSRTNNRQRMLSQRMLSLINNCCVNHCRTITAGCWLPQRLASRRAVECRQFERTAHLLGLLIVVAPLLAGCALPGQTARNQATRNQALDGPTPLQSQPQSQPLAAQQQPVPGQVGSMTGAVQQVAYHGGMTQASGYQSHDQGHYQGHANCAPCNTPQYSQQPQQCTAGCCGTAAPIYPT